MKKILFTLLLFIVTSNYLFSQDFNLPTLLPRVTKPEPSVSSLMKFEEIPVSNYTGVPNISVPIYSLPTRSKDISLDIALGYHPSSVALNEIPGDCGIGWSLFAGGVISRETIGKPDEYNNGYADAKQSDVYQFNFLGHIGRFYLNKNAQGILDVRILENANSKLVITVNYNLTTYLINSFTVYDDKGYQYVFQDFDTQAFYNPYPVFSYKSTFHLTKVIDNNNVDLITFHYDTYSEYITSGYTNLYKKSKDAISEGYGKVNFIYSTSNFNYSANIRIIRLDLLDYGTNGTNGTVLKKNTFQYNSNNLIKVENCNVNETIKETYEFKYKNYVNIPNGVSFEVDDWGYRRYKSNCLYSYPITNLNNNISANYCDMGVLNEIDLPTGGSINYKYESNTYSTYKRDTNGEWQLIDDPVNYYNDSMPENYIINTLTYNEFTGNGVNVVNFTVPGNIGAPPIQYYYNLEVTPYIQPGMLGPDGQPVTQYPYFKLNGYGQNNVTLSGLNNSQNLCQGEIINLYPGRTYTITINASTDITKIGKIYFTNRENKPNPSKNLYGAGIRIKQIANFDKKVSNYFDDIAGYNAVGIFPAKQKSFSYNFFDHPDRSSGAVVYPAFDIATNSRVKREPVGYKNVTVSESGNGKEEFTFTSPMDFDYDYPDDGIHVVYYDYRRGLLTNKKTYTLTNVLLVDSDLTYAYVETPDPTVFFDNPALNERLGWSKLSQVVTKNFFSNNTLPQTITETFTYDDAIRKISTKIRTTSLSDEIKIKYSYHVGNSTYSQNRIAELEKVESYRGNNLLFTSKVQYGNSWNNNVSYLPNVMQSSKSSQPLENLYKITAYDNYSHPTEIQQENRMYVTLIWGYNKTKVIAKILNASNAQICTALGISNISLATEVNLGSIDALRTNASLQNIMITTYSYIPLVGISTITDPKGDKLTYLYDSFSRIRTVMDKNNKIVSETVYTQALNNADFDSVKNIFYKIETGTSNSSPSVTDAVQNKTFFDGLGRPIQSIAYQQSNTSKDIVSYFEYDSCGRMAIDYLPYTNQSSSLNYNYTAKTDLLNYSPTDFSPTYISQNPFIEKRYEPSPLNRIVEMAAPGSEWSLNNPVKHTIRYEYLNNTNADNVRMFTATSDFVNNTITLNNTATGIYYTERELTKIIVKNENWKTGDGNNNTTESFTDKEGHVVMTRVYGNSLVNNVAVSVWHETYTVYDQYGNVTFVIPPIADGAIDTSQRDNLCYQYKYDNSNRLIEKKIPGKNWQYMVYDKLNRIVATGPSFTPFTDLQTTSPPPAPQTIGWLIRKYDAYNRSILTGWLQSSAITSVERTTLQGLYNNSSLPVNETKSASDVINGANSFTTRYTNDAIPSSYKTLYHVLTINYFDDYNTNLTFNPAISYTSSISPEQVYYNNTSGTFPKGLPTISWVRVPETSLLFKAEKNYILYDRKARVVKMFSNNYLDGYSQVENQLQPMTGRPNYTLITHKRLQASTVVTLRDDYAYTNQDRLLTHTHKIVGAVNPTELLSKNDYTELGKLITKRVGGSDTSGAASFQKIDYSFNIRGWLLGINDVTDLKTSTEKDLFAFGINYNNAITNNDGGNVVPLYNGNIAEIDWRSSTDNRQRRYGYQYDNLNRLKKAIYQKTTTNIVATSSYDESISYDKNGNIMKLVRNGDLDNSSFPITIDNLTYTYEPDKKNQLIKVFDSTNHPEGFTDDGDGISDPADDYSYDINGNMLTDQNKHITSITYNHLNLPLKIVFNNDQKTKIEYTYNAVGMKLKKAVTKSCKTCAGGVGTTTTDYLSGFQYTKAILSLFPTAEGYVNNTVVSGNNVYNYVYNYTDHLGNVRMSYTKDPATGFLKILEENNYYPFGLKHTKYNVETYTFVDTETVGYNTGDDVIIANGTSLYQYKFNGKEYQDELSLNMTAMDYRQYDSVLGRFNCIDPLAETSVGLTPYHFGNDNPGYWSDPSGLRSGPGKGFWQAFASFILGGGLATLLEEVPVQNTYQQPNSFVGSSTFDGVGGSFASGFGYIGGGGGGGGGGSAVAIGGLGSIGLVPLSQPLTATSPIILRPVAQMNLSPQPVTSTTNDFSLVLMYLHFQIGGGETLAINTSSINLVGLTQSNLGLTGMTSGQMVEGVNIFNQGVTFTSLALGRVNMIYRGNNQFEIIDRFDFYPLYDPTASRERNGGNLLGAYINYNLFLSPILATIPLIFGGGYDIQFDQYITIPK